MFRTLSRLRALKNVSFRTHTISRRCILLSEPPTFDKNPALHIELDNAEIDILTLSHWVDIQYFEQNKLGDCATLEEWIESKSATHILLDICPNRLDWIYQYNVENPKPEELTEDEMKEVLSSLNTGNEADIDEVNMDAKYFLSEENIRDHFAKLRKQSKKMKRFIEKVDRLDEIHKYKMVTSANKMKQNRILNEYKLTEPLFTEVDIW